jgi:hypothetical protein
MVQSVSLPEKSLSGAKSRIKSEQVAYSHKFNWVMTALGGWLVLGVVLDSLAHVNGLPDSFFTPWHGVLYSGGLSLCTVLLTVVVGNYVKGYSWSKAVPKGYGLAVIGAMMFIGAGIFDMVWHVVFGIERNLEAALSPSHTALVTAMTLLLTGPFVSAWKKTNTSDQNWNYWLPALLSLVFLLLPSNLILSFANPYFRTYASRNYGLTGDVALGMGVLSCLFYTLLFTTIVLLLVRRWTLPPGFLVAFVFCNLILGATALQSFKIIPLVPMLGMAFAGGLIVEIFYRWFQPSAHNLKMVHQFAFAVPFSLAILYFLVVALFGGGIGWTVHIWTGVIVASGGLGWLLSFVAFPSPVATATEK